MDIGWQRTKGCLKTQVIFRKRATNYKALLRKMTHRNKASYESSPLCIMEMTIEIPFQKALQCTATHCNALQCTATHCNALQCTTVHCNALQHTATPGNTRQHMATHGNTRHHTATHGSTRQHTAALGSTRQHATNCITLQHTPL